MTFVFSYSGRHTLYTPGLYRFFISPLKVRSRPSVCNVSSADVSFTTL